MDKNYLPSKLFLRRVIVILALIVIIFGVSKLVGYIKGKRSSNKAPANVQVKDVVQKDSNGNGIPDWEEYLWGLDPTKNGNSNKQYILDKKKALAANNENTDAIDGSKQTNDNDLLTQEFFATVLALQQTGQLDETALKSVAEAAGKNIDITPLQDIYTSKMLKIKDDSLVSKNSYHSDIVKLVSKYSDANIGSELIFVIQGLSNNDPQALYAAKTVADAYKSFGKDFMSISVPQSLSQTHLSVANNYEKVGESIDDLTKMLYDPLSSMRGIINYKNYSDSLGEGLDNISNALQ